MLHNGRYPCRFCLILAIQGLTANGGTHLYCPLHRPKAPLFSVLKLPLRTHNQTIQKGLEILQAASENARAKLATDSGVKGVSLLARLPSVSVPGSFPIDIMHMVWINLVPHLVKLWTGEFNGLDNGSESYMFNPTLWMSLGATVAGSGATIPSSFGCRVSDISKPTHNTAESWSIFATQLAPSLLRRRFRKPVYYTHFVQLIKLLNQCTSYSMVRSDIVKLRQGFADCIEEYERYATSSHNTSAFRYNQLTET